MIKMELEKSRTVGFFYAGKSIKNDAKMSKMELIKYYKFVNPGSGKFISTDFIKIINGSIDQH
jgi:hypothetical protein